MDSINASDFDPFNRQSNIESMENNSELNKENSDSEKFFKNTSSRMSILQSLDPLNPYSPTNQKFNFQIKDKIIEPFVNSTDQLNESWNVLGLDASEMSSSQHEAVLNATPFDICEKDALVGINDLNKTFNESQFLNLSVENNNVDVDNLLSLSPVRPVVDKSVHEQLKKVYITKRMAWLETESQYLEEIEKLKMHNDNQSMILTEQESKIDFLTKEKESRIDEMKAYQIKFESELAECRNQHKLQISELVKEKDSIINDLVRENEENIENLQTKHSKLLARSQTELGRISEELEKLRNECLELNSTNAINECILDQYYDSLEQAIIQYAENEDALYKDNEEMEISLNKHINKFQSSLEVVKSQKQNVEMLQDQLKKRDMKIALLEKAQSNLNRELELRISERDSYKDALDKYLQ